MEQEPTPNRNLGQQWHQLAMFHTADHLVHNVEHGDVFAYKDHAQMWKRKLDEARSFGWHDLHDSIANEGVKEPVSMRAPEPKLGTGEMLLNGHHRAISAYTHDPKMLVPVQYQESYSEMEREYK